MLDFKDLFLLSIQSYAAEAGPERAEQPIETAGMSDDILQKVTLENLVSLSGDVMFYDKMTNRLVDSFLDGSNLFQLRFQFGVTAPNFCLLSAAR